jgi:hypothetical protein
MRILPCLLALLLAACSTHRARPVEITVTPENVSVKAPPFITVGDSLKVLVHDTRYANRYIAVTSESALVAMPRAPIFGDTSLKAVSLKFAPSRNLPASAAPSTRQELMELTGSEKEATDSAEVELVILTARIRARLDTLRTIVAGDPAEYARLRLLEDTSWIRVAQAVVNDSAPARITALLDSLADQGTRAVIGTTRLEATRRDAERYGRRLDALRARLPAQPGGVLQDTSRVPDLLRLLGDDVQSYESLHRTADGLYLDAQRAARDAGDPLPTAPRIPPFPSMRVSGIDIFPWLRDPDRLAQKVDDIQAQLADVNRQTLRLVNALNQLPAWTETNETASIFTQMFPSEKQVRVVVLRRDRYEPFAIATGAAAAVTPPPPAKKEETAAAEAGTVTVTTTTTFRQPAPVADDDDDDSVGNDDDDADVGNETGRPESAAARAEAGGGAEVPSGQTLVLSSVTAPRVDTVAVLNIPVLQQYRFHLGVGMVYSTLKTGVFETRADTVADVPGVNVVRVGEDEDRLLPMAVLSYTVFPFGGRYNDARAFQRLPALNLSVQAGISLNDPSENLYAGLSGEFFPGLEIGAGHHFGYVTTTNREGDFVPLSEPATAKKWLNDWAVSATIDATLFARTLGRIFGLTQQ